MIPILTVASIMQLQKNDPKNKDFSFYALLARDLVNIIKVRENNPLARETVTMYSKDMKDEIQSGKRYLLKGSKGFITTFVSNLWYRRKDVGKYTILYTFVSERSPIYVIEIYNRKTMHRVISLRLSKKNSFIHFVDKGNVVQYIKYDDNAMYYDFYKVTKDKVLHYKGQVNINHKDKGQYAYDTNFHTFFRLTNRDRSFFISPPVVNSKGTPKEKLLTVIESTHVEQVTLYHKLFNSYYNECNSNTGYNIHIVYNGKTKKKEYAFVGINDHIYTTKNFPMYLLWSRALSTDGQYIGAVYKRATLALKGLASKNKYVYGFVLYKKNQPVAFFMRTVLESSSVFNDTNGHMYVKSKGKYMYVFLAYHETVEMLKYKHDDFKTPLLHRKISLKRENLSSVFSNYADDMIEGLLKDTKRSSATSSSTAPYIHNIIYSFRTPKALSLYAKHVKIPVKVYNDNFFTLNGALFYIDKKGKLFVSPYDYKKIDNNKYLVEITTPYNCENRLGSSFADDLFRHGYNLYDRQIHKQVVLLNTVTGTVKPLVFRDIKQQGAVISMILPGNNSKNHYILNLYGTKGNKKEQYTLPFSIVISTINKEGNTKPVFGINGEGFNSIFSEMAYKHIVFTESNSALIAHIASKAFSSLPLKDWRDVLFVVKDKRLYNLNCSVGFRSMKALNAFTRDKKAVNNLYKEEQR